MSFSLALAIIIVADIALIGGLAYVMSRASLLTPHVSAREADAGTTAGAADTVPAALRSVPLHAVSRAPGIGRVDSQPSGMTVSGSRASAA
jgi:hypothetical protein